MNSLTWRNELSEFDHSFTVCVKYIVTGSTARFGNKINPLKHSGHYMYCTVVTICTAQRSIYVPHRGHYMYRTVVTICTAQLSLCTVQWSLYVPHSGHYMYHQFNIHKLYVLPTRCICVFCVDLRTNSDYFPFMLLPAILGSRPDHRYTRRYI
jgi:hypothetical protein